MIKQYARWCTGQSSGNICMLAPNRHEWRGGMSLWMVWTRPG